MMLLALLIWAALGAAIARGAFVPNPFVEGRPQSWGVAAAEVGLAALAAAFGGLALAGASGLLAGRLTNRGIVAAALGSALVFVVAASVGLVVRRGDVVVAPACDGYAFRREDWTDGDRRTRQRVALWIRACGVIAGKTEVQVLRLLGDPKDVVGHPSSDVLVYPYLVVQLNPETRRVVETGARRTG